MSQPPSSPGRALDAGGPAALTAVGLEVYRDALAGVAEEMGAALRRAAFSPNIKERTDCPAAVFGPDGDLVAQAEHIPVHLGAMPASVRALIDTFGPPRVADAAGSREDIVELIAANSRTPSERIRADTPGGGDWGALPQAVPQKRDP